MLASIEYNNKTYKIDLKNPLDISIPVKFSDNTVNAWYLDSPKINPVKSDDWVGSVKLGSSVNFNTINFNPHAHGTHTECVGHITEKVHSINSQLQQFFFLAQLISIAPVKIDTDKVVGKKELLASGIEQGIEALIIRTLPNMDDKLTKHYSHTNPPYLSKETVELLVDLNIKHLLFDLPSVDKEKDGGKLLAHNAFWRTGGNVRMDATITELIYVDNKIEDGLYILNLQIAPFENDATPSKPILYKLID